MASSLHSEHSSGNSVNLVSISVPYMLHLQPVTTTSSFSDATRLDSVKSEEEESPDDGMEQIFNSCTQLRYGCDLRLNEVCFFPSVCPFLFVFFWGSKCDYVIILLLFLLEEKFVLTFGIK